MSSPHEDAPAAQCGGGNPSSRQVSWYEVYAFAARWSSSLELDLLSQSQLVAGTPQWCSLRDDDARKLLALLLGGVREALQHDADQEHRAEASRAVSSSSDWAAVAKQIRAGRGDAYIPRKRSA